MNYYPLPIFSRKNNKIIYIPNKGSTFLYEIYKKGHIIYWNVIDFNELAI